MKRIFSILLMTSGLLLLVLGLSFAFRLSSGNYTEHTETQIVDKEASIRIPIPDSVIEIDPRIQVSMNLKAISNAMYSRLVRINDVGEVEPDLAENWSFDLSRQEVLIKIRNGVTFHDGSQVSSDDVIASFEIWLQPKALDSNLLFDVEGAEQFASGKADKIIGIRKIDSNTIGISLVKRFTEDFVYALTTPRFYIYKKGSERQKRPLGSGPFRLQHADKSKVVLKRNEQYYGRISGSSELVFYSGSKDDAIRDLSTKQSHALFAYSDFRPKDFNDKNIRVIPMKKTTTGILFFMNQGNGKSEKFRKDVSSLFRRERLRQECYPEGTLAERIIPPGLRGSVPLRNVMLKSSSLIPSSARLPVLYSTTIESRCLYNSLKEDYGRYGGTIQEFSSLEELYSHFQKGRVSFAFERLTFKSLDPSNVLQYFNPASAEYFLKEEVPELSALFKQLGNVETSAQKSNILSLIDAFLVESSFVIPLQHETFYTAYSSDLVGFTQADFGSIAGLKWEELGLRIRK